MTTWPAARSEATMKRDDPKFLLEMLRTGMLGVFNYGLDGTPDWMLLGILEVAEQVSSARVRLRRCRLVVA